MPLRAFSALLAISTLAAILCAPSWARRWPQYRANPFVIHTGLPMTDPSAGSIVVHELTGDGLPDYIITVPGHVGAFSNAGRRLWMVQADINLGGPSESRGLPGHHAPGVQAGDIDGDRRAEVLFLTNDGAIHCLDGRTGRQEWTFKPPAPKGAQRWEHLVIVNLRGRGDRDLILQATNARGYRMGRYIAACWIEDLRKARWQPLWQRDDFIACAHNGARAADLDGDGRDEIFSGTILSPEGKVLCQLPVRGHLDSVFVGDVRPDLPGLEVVALEEGANRVFLFGTRGVIWITENRRQEPQNAAVGEFDLKRPGLEIWCRSRYNEHQKPWIFDAFGKLIRQYNLDDVAPPGWTVRGVEVIYTIDWTGEPKQLACAKERHRSGDVCIFDPISGKFVKRIKEHADRLYVADVSGDWREEVIVVNRDEIHVYHNDAPNPRPRHPRLWRLQWYRRCKMTWNYYSP